jgi:hypothetical protein
LITSRIIILELGKLLVPNKTKGMVIYMWLGMEFVIAFGYIVAKIIGA